MSSWFVWLKRLLPIGVMLCAMAFLGTAIQTYAREAPSEDAFSPVVYILLVAGCMVTGLTPSMPIVILSGKIFHWFPAALYTVVGAAIGTFAGYAVGRWVAGRPCPGSLERPSCCGWRTGLRRG